MGANRSYPTGLINQRRTPCEISDRKVRTVNELAALATEHLRSAECANGKIETIALIIGPQ